ncbi:uncharacterized protein L201_005924 [Kwoniella dendrophila CBS 6074]|uniref:RRM domain-containing protein n=1 Tax=Kwoniella dendrophila CBS 6074 TaxID=1295534 RepID=A0AAX4K028_9TREE
MVRPTLSLSTVAGNAIRAQKINRQPIIQVTNDAERNLKRGHNLLIHEIPKTALPSDIVRALKDVGAVDSGFSVSSITSFPPSLPKTPSLYRTIHLNLHSSQRAGAISKILSEKPIFGTNSNLSSRSSSSLNTRSFKSSSSKSEGITNKKNQAQLTNQTSTEWTKNIIHKFLSDRPHFDQQRDKQIESSFNEEWCNKQSLKGRRVVIKGLPGSIVPHELKKLGKDCNLSEEFDGCVKLPSSRHSAVATYSLTTNTVNDAHRLARKLHMKYYKADTHGENWLMRAHVHY